MWLPRAVSNSPAALQVLPSLIAAVAAGTVGMGAALDSDEPEGVAPGVDDGAALGVVEQAASPSIAARTNRRLMDADITSSVPRGLCRSIWEPRRLPGRSKPP